MNWRKHITHIVIALEVVLVMAAFAVAPLRARAIHGDALRIARDMELVANSVTAMYTNEGNWPGDAAAGQTPAALASSLPPAFKFSGKSYQLDWDYWRLCEGQKRYAKTAEFAALSLTANDPRVLRDVIATAGKNCMHFTVGNRVTFVLSIPPARVW